MGVTPDDPQTDPSGRGSWGGHFWGTPGYPQNRPPRDPPKVRFWGGTPGYPQKYPKNLKKWGRRLSATFVYKKVAEGAFPLLKVSQKKPLIRRPDPQNPTFGVPWGVGFGPPKVTPKPTPWGGGREGSLLDPPKPTPKPTPPGGSLLGYPGGTPNRPPKPTPPGGGRIGVSWGEDGGVSRMVVVSVEKRV